MAAGVAHGSNYGRPAPPLAPLDLELVEEVWKANGPGLGCLCGRSDIRPIGIMVPLGIKNRIPLFIHFGSHDPDSLAHMTPVRPEPHPEPTATRTAPLEPDVGGAATLTSPGTEPP
jgi:hypothetical protein